MWAYARIDTIKYEHLHKMKKAGINWLGGIESANTDVRDRANKQMRRKDIVEVVRRIQLAVSGLGQIIYLGCLMTPLRLCRIL